MMLVLPAEPLVSTAWLAAHLDHPGLRVVDSRGTVLPAGSPPPYYLPEPGQYAAGHIPGAVFLDWTTDIVDLDDPIPIQLASPHRFAETMRRLGIGDDTCVVVYEESYPHLGARLWWALRYYGHDDVRVLDGGISKWISEGRPLDQQVPSPAPAVFTPRPRPWLRRDAGQVLASLGTAVLIDARGQPEYAGEISRAQRAGHIPGAANVWYRDLYANPDGTALAPDQIRARLTQAGLDLDALHGRELVCYCNAGVSAAAAALGLMLAGGPEAAIYDGSWNEWGNRAELPIASGG